MANIIVKIIDQNTLQLDEDARKGDIIDLKEAISVDLSYVQNLIEQEKNNLLEKRLSAQKLELENFYAQKIETLKKEFELNKQSDITKNQEVSNKKISDLNISYTSLKSEYQNLEEKNKNKLDLLKTQYEYEKKSVIESLKIERLKETTELNRKIQELQASLDSLKEQQQKSIDIEKMKVAEQYRNEINSKNAEINTLKQKEVITNLEFQNKELSIKNKLEEEHKKEIDSIQKELKDVQSRYDQLSLSKSIQNVKTLGEELEKWCTQEYENASLAGFTNCTWRKDNEVIKDLGDEKGTKADFIFKVYSSTPSDESHPISSVCLEMKNESNVSTSKKKNSDHYKKLDEDRKKKNCEYALLVSELEWDTANDSPIKKVTEYEKMYVVRPQYMITFLSIVYSLSSKYSEIINAKNKEALNLKESQELIDEFESLKKTYLENPLVALEKQINDINKNNDKILEFANKNRELISKIISDTISNIVTKIERFNVIKLAKKRDKIDS